MVEFVFGGGTIKVNNRDNGGNIIGAGDRVCFNWSGQIAYGAIVEINQGIRYGNPYPIIKILRLMPTNPREAYKYSTVTSFKNLYKVV